MDYRRYWTDNNIHSKIASNLLVCITVVGKCTVYSSAHILTSKITETEAPYTLVEIDVLPCLAGGEGRIGIICSMTDA